MTRDELIRRLRKIARKDELLLEVIEGRGKGSHVIVVLGTRKTVLPLAHGRDLKRGTLNGILKDLGINPRRL